MQIGQLVALTIQAQLGALSLRQDKVGAAVLLPALLVVLGAERPLLAPARGFHSFGGNAERNQKVFCGFGAPLAEAEIVFRRASLIAMSFERNMDLRIRAQKLCIFGESAASIVA